MDRPDYRYYYHVTVTEERIESLRRERRLQAQMRRDRPPSMPRPDGRRRWSVADVVCPRLPGAQRASAEGPGR